VVLKVLVECIFFGWFRNYEFADGAFFGSLPRSPQSELFEDGRRHFVRVQLGNQKGLLDGDSLDAQLLDVLEHHQAKLMLDLLRTPGVDPSIAADDTLVLQET
jgi:hypothetical protein